MEKERIQKVIAEAGEYSRRAVERLIDEKKIKVNGIVVTTKGIKVDPSTDRIQINGKAFEYQKDQELVAILVNKPRRVMVTRNDPEGRKTIYEMLPKKYAKLKPVGRLDFMSQGALILTNDGDLILKLTHPRYHLVKIYQVKVSSHPEDHQLERMGKGVVIDGSRTMPADIKVIEKNQSSSVIEFKLQEGRNRQIRKMCEAVGLTVKELRRVSIGPVRIRGLRSGEHRSLSENELKRLIEAIPEEI